MRRRHRLDRTVHLELHERVELLPVYILNQVARKTNRQKGRPIRFGGQNMGNSMTTPVRPENYVRGLRSERVSAGVICDNQMTGSGAKGSIVAVSALQTRGVSACRIRRTEYLG